MHMSDCTQQQPKSSFGGALFDRIMIDVSSLGFNAATDNTQKA